MPAKEGEGSVEVTVLKNPDGLIRIFPASDGKCRITVEPQAGRFVPGLTCVTSYPLDLIEQIHAAKGIYTCNEILREEDPSGARHFLYHDVLSYLPPDAFAGKRVLDFGCGSGASTMALFRAVPASEIVGIDLEEKLLRMQRKVDTLEARAKALQRAIAELEEVKRSVKAEIVRYEAPGTALIPVVRRSRRR